MAKDLTVELKRISRLVNEALSRGESEAVRNNQGFSGRAVVLKCGYTMDVLDIELPLLLRDFRRKDHLNKILEWLDDQHALIFASFKKHGYSQSTYDVLDERMGEIKGVLKNRRISFISNAREDWIKFWIPIALSIIALLYSVASGLFGFFPHH